MATFGELIKAAVGTCARRGDVFWIKNAHWRLGIFFAATSSHHPGLVLANLQDREHQVAPGTSQRVRDARLQPFEIQHPEVLNGNRSTFFLGQQVPIRERCFNGHMGSLHPEDLARLDAVFPAAEIGT